jgi:hypothetical protein
MVVQVPAQLKRVAQHRQVAFASRKQLPLQPYYIGLFHIVSARQDIEKAGLLLPFGIAPLG